MANPADGKTFEEYRQQLYVEASRLASYVRIYRKLHERRYDRLAEMNLAPAFFTTVTDALGSAIVLWVDKIFDEHSERGLYNFLSFVEHHRHLLQREKIDFQMIQRDREAIRSFVPLQSFRLRRDKFHAHFDRDYFFHRERLGDHAPLTWGDLENTLTLLSDLLNRYSTAYDGNRLVLEPVNGRDLDDLLDKLHQGKAEGHSKPRP